MNETDKQVVLMTSDVAMFCCHSSKRVFMTNDLIRMTSIPRTSYIEICRHYKKKLGDDECLILNHLIRFIRSILPMFVLFVCLRETPVYSPLVGLKASRINLVDMSLFSITITLFYDNSSLNYRVFYSRLLVLNPLSVYAVFLTRLPDLGEMY